MIRKCSLCPQTFDDNAMDWKWRKIRHQDHHDPSCVHGSYNQTWGKVEWLKIE